MAADFAEHSRCMARRGVLLLGGLVLVGPGRGRLTEPRPFSSARLSLGCLSSLAGIALLAGGYSGSIAPSVGRQSQFRRQHHVAAI
jgi:hypothetical protein